MSLQQIFVDLKLHDTIVIKPWQLNNELYLHLKQNLKNKVENKCIDAGYICNINDIIDYNDGYLLPEDFNSDVYFRVTYNAKVCVVIPNIYMVCKVSKLVKSVLIAENGPAIVLIKYIDINSNLFKINNSGEMINANTNKKIQINDHIKIRVKSKKSYTGDKNICIIGFLEDVLDENFHTQYMFKNMDDDEINVKSTSDIENIIMNEENDDDNENIKKSDNNSYIMNI
jgi:DNA-directed RNA polymerase subunit E'/Rpb7